MSFNSSACTPGVVEALSSVRWAWFEAAIVTYTGYGVVLTLALLCFNLIVQNIISSPRDEYAPPKRVPLLNVRLPEFLRIRTRTLVSLSFVLAMTILASIAVASMTKTMHYAYVDLGCWSGLTAARWGGVVDRKGHYVFVIANWGSDGMLVWRCWAIYRCSIKVPVHVSLALPIMLYTSVIAMGIFFMVPKVHGVRGPEGARMHELIYSSLTLSLNLVATSMIVLRLLVYRNRIITAMGRSQGIHYASYVSIFVESAVLVVMVNLFLLVTMHMQSDLQTVAFHFNLQVQIIASLLILVRVLQGKAWSCDTDKVITLANLQTHPEPMNLETLATTANEHNQRRPHKKTLSLIRFARPMSASQLEGADEDRNNSIKMTVYQENAASNLTLDSGRAV